MTARPGADFAVRVQYEDGTHFPDDTVDKLDWFVRATAERIAGAAYNAAVERQGRVRAVEIINSGFEIVHREEVPEDD